MIQKEAGAMTPGLDLSAQVLLPDGNPAPAVDVSRTSRTPAVGPRDRAAGIRSPGKDLAQVDAAHCRPVCRCDNAIHTVHCHEVVTKQISQGFSGLNAGIPHPGSRMSAGEPSTPH